jgi:hypothetical protein
MNTVRLALTGEFGRTMDFLQTALFPSLTRAEIIKVSVGQIAVMAKRSKKVFDYDDSDLTPKEIMYQASKSFDIDNDDEPVFWDETLVKPLKLKSYV